MNKYEIQPDQDATDNVNDPLVQRISKFLAQNQTKKTLKDNQSRAMRKFFDEQLEMHYASDNTLILCKKLQQVFWKFTSRIKVLDFILNGTGEPEHAEKLATDGFATCLRRSGFIQAFRAKGGVFQNVMPDGDAFLVFGTSGNTKGFPFKFAPVLSSKVFVQYGATSMRFGARPMRKFAFVTDHTFEEAKKMYPKKKISDGYIPVSGESNFATDEDQADVNKDDYPTQILHYYDLDIPAYVVCVGRKMTIVERYEGEAYKFNFQDDQTLEESPYIPVAHFFGLEAMQGFYNHSPLASLFDLSVQYAKTMNQLAGHANEVVDPLTFLYTPMNESGKVMQQIKMVREARKKGLRAMVPIEMNANSPANSQISVQPMTYQGLINEAQFLQEQIDLEVKRLGFHLDEMDNPDALATKILADEENANAFIKQWWEKNADEFEFILKVCIQQIPDIISPDDDTILDMSTTVTDPETGESVKIDNLTLGHLSSTFAAKHYFAKANARSGVDASRMKTAALRELLASAAPGTAAYTKIMGQIAASRDLDLTGEDFGAPPAQAGPAQEAIPETERLAINPRLSAQAAAI